MIAKVLTIIAFCILSIDSFAESTGKSKVIYTQGHIHPKCRVVQIKVNETSKVMYFRIAEVDGKDNVNSVILAGLMGNRDVDITYDPAQTTGCGSEPKILYVSVY